MTDLLPTLASAAGEPDTVEKLKAGVDYGGRSFKVHLDGYDQTDLFTGKSEKSARKFVFYYDETVLTAIRYDSFKVTFSIKEGGHWDDPLIGLGRPMITNLRMDPFERQTGDVNRQYAEHKTWVLTPIIGIAEKHLMTFKDFPVRQLGLSAQMGKTIEGIQSQILKIRQQP
jgi:arylsulfatase A-like enzyme